jgi:hypothetical protein
VLASYVAGYFDKELLHLRSQYLCALRRAVEDPAGSSQRVSVSVSVFVSGGSLLQAPPCLRAEKLKSISSVAASIANRQFLDSVFAMTTDAVARMESIGREDRRLGHCLKEAFLLQLGLLVEGCLLPSARACVSMLLKLCAARPAKSALPPVKLLAVVAALVYGRARLRAHFEDTFQRRLATAPNLAVVCKEARRSACAKLQAAVGECLHAWVLAASGHVAKAMRANQSSYEYAPSQASQASQADCSATCALVCRAIAQVTSAVRQMEPQVAGGVDVEQAVWRPFGSQCVAGLISHLSKLKVTAQGAKMLLRDVQEYKHVS